MHRQIQQREREREKIVVLSIFHTCSVIHGDFKQIACVLFVVKTFNERDEYTYKKNK